MLGANGAGKTTTLRIIATLLSPTAGSVRVAGCDSAVDAIAGEKERGTIETLLIAPCRPWEFASGKFVAVFVVTLLTLLSNILSLGMTAAVTQRLLPASLSLVPRQSAAGVAMALVSFTALAALGTALCLAVTTWSRSTKEAQHSLTPVIIVVSLLSGFAIGPSATAASAVAAVPFAGQVVVAREALLVGQAESPMRAAVGLLVPLLVTLASAAIFVAVLVRATASFLVDEEVLFRGPDAADGILSRPAFRVLPTVAQGIAPAAAAVASLWYLQAFVPDDLLVAIPVQQAVSLAIPLVVIASWQRVDLRRTLRLALPAKGRSLATLLGAAALVGLGLFVVGVAAVLTLVGEDASADMKVIATRLMKLVMERPVWLSWILIAVGWMAMATGSLLPGIVCHAAHNTVPIVLVLLAGGTASPDAAAWPIWLPVAGAVAVLFGGFTVASEARRSAG